MTRKAKLFLLFAALVLLGLVGLGIAATVSLSRMAWGGASRTMVHDPGRVQEIARSIAGFDPPPGFRPGSASQLLGFAMAEYNRGDAHSHLMLFQIPRWVPLNEDFYISQARASAGDDESSPDEIKLIEQREIRVGEHTILYAVHEGVNDAEMPYRSLQMIFPGRNGTVLLIFQEPLDRWDDALARALLASLH